MRNLVIPFNNIKGDDFKALREELKQLNIRRTNLAKEMLAAFLKTDEGSALKLMSKTTSCFCVEVDKSWIKVIPANNDCSTHGLTVSNEPLPVKTQRYLDPKTLNLLLSSKLLSELEKRELLEPYGIAGKAKA